MPRISIPWSKFLTHTYYVLQLLRSKNVDTQILTCYLKSASKFPISANGSLKTISLIYPWMSSTICHHDNSPWLYTTHAKCLKLLLLYKGVWLSAQNPHPWVRPSPCGGLGLTCSCSPPLYCNVQFQSLKWNEHKTRKFYSRIPGQQCLQTL